MKQNIKISATNLLQEMMLHALGRFRTRHLPVQQGHAHQISPALTHKWGTDWGGGGEGILQAWGVGIQWDLSGSTWQLWVIKVKSVLYWLLNFSIRTETRAKGALGPQKNLVRGRAVYNAGHGARDMQLWKTKGAGGGLLSMQTCKWIRAIQPESAGRRRGEHWCSARYDTLLRAKSTSPF